MQKQLLFVLISLILIAEEISPPSHEVIEKELEDAQEKFDAASKMFNPWYAGPLLTGSAHTLDPGLYNQQPYLFVFDNYGIYSKSGHSRPIHDLVVVNPVYIAQTGIVKGWDLSATLQGFYNKQRGKDSVGFGDLPIAFGIALLQETPYLPAIKLGLSETFPTGKYRRLNPNNNGLDATGSGSYITTFTLNLSKVVWWITLHPMSFRASLNYKLPSKVHVKGFNAYGGGYGTNGKVTPGQSFIGNIAFEYSFTQKWVFATDLSYVYNHKSTFRGNPGVSATGNNASVGVPYNNSFSIAPAIEYNPYATMGFVGGIWFTVWGTNSFNFISGILSYTQVF